MLTIPRLLSAVIYVVLLIGFANRGRRRVHIPMMIAAFTADMGLVLYLEFTRDAIGTALHTHSGLMRFHVGLSVVVVLLYLGQIYSGIRKARNRRGFWHGKGGIALLVTRLGNLITSFIIHA